MQKNQNAVRYRAARIDARISSIARRIEKDYKLPDGSVVLVYPSGRRPAQDITIEDLLKKWGAN